MIEDQGANSYSAQLAVNSIGTLVTISLSSMLAQSGERIRSWY